MPEIDILSYLDTKQVDHRPATATGEVYLKDCPYCEPGGDGDFSHFSFNINKAVFRCKKCGAKGNFWKYRMDVFSDAPISRAGKKQYVKLSENPSHFQEIDKFYEWYQRDRGISPEVLKRFRVGCEWRKGNCYIVYHYFSQSGALKDRKYRHFTNKKDMKTEVNAEKTYYGAHLLDDGIGHLFVTEGEDDCMALWQLGFTNVVSVHSGAGSYSEGMDAINKKFKAIYLFYDNDPDGQEGARTFAEKAGYHKCYNVILPFKDARDCLLEGYTKDMVGDLMDTAKQFKQDKIVRPSEIEADLIRAYFDAKHPVGFQVGSKKFNSLFGGVRIGEMTTCTGHTGHGKTTGILNLCWWLLKEGVPCLVLSFENREKSALMKMIQICSGDKVYDYNSTGKRVLCVDREWVSGQIRKLDGYPLYFLNTGSVALGYMETDDMISIVEYAVKIFDVRFVVIDHLHYFVKIKDPNHGVHYLDESVRKIKQATIRLGIHVVLVAHPSKTEDSSTGRLYKLSLNCVKGSSAIPQESDNFLVIERPTDPSMKNKSRWRALKNREEGTLGEVVFDVKENNNTFLEGEEW